MTKLKLTMTIATATVLYDQLFSFPYAQWLWERGLTGGIYGLCLGVVLGCAGLIVVRQGQ